MRPVEDIIIDDEVVTGGGGGSITSAGSGNVILTNTPNTVLSNKSYIINVDSNVKDADIPPFFVASPPLYLSFIAFIEVPLYKDEGGVGRLK